MDKKANSKQMRAIIQRLQRYGEFEVSPFGDDTILNKPIEEWPIVTCLLSWHSDCFPLKKAQAYVALRKPYLVNDIFSQDILLDRRRVYRKLAESGIPTPFHIIVDRDDLPPGQTDPPGFIEHEDYVELKGVRIDKPFVEKPASGEDHNVYIYYPHSMGGGVKRLFRKVDNRSADYDPSHPGTVRREGSFIYEEFLTTGGTDVKVYTVGPRYAHAEARKSPVVDGKVQRTADGKEVRFPVLLSPQEKEIARMVCLAFGQRVCGFDLLRSERGKSYVCDVNGWSFVKNSQKYYDDTAGILRMIILSAVAPHRLLVPPPLPEPCEGLSVGGAGVFSPEGLLSGGSGAAGIDSETMRSPQSYSDVRIPGQGGVDAQEGGGGGRHPDEELRCVLAVVRHGDRTPKQKMKMKVTQPALLALLHKYLDSKGKQAKLKSPNELQELLDVTRQLLEESDASHRAAAAASNGGGGGGGGSNATSNSSTPAASSLSLDAEADELRERFRIIKTVLEQGGQFAGINRKVQLKPLKWENSDGGDGGDDQPPRCVEALLILKHGGVLTHAGRQQAEALGSLFRNIMYPNQGPAGGGLLRLHSTYRHDLKIYSSDEGRVQTSAAAFTKGLLDLEGAALTPILVSLVKKDAGMLDAFGKGASADISAAKQELYAQMTFDVETNTSTFAEPTFTTASVSSALLSPPRSPEPGAPPLPPPPPHSSTATSTASIPDLQQQQQQQQQLVQRAPPSVDSSGSIATSANGNGGIQLSTAGSGEVVHGAINAVTTQSNNNNQTVPPLPPSSARGPSSLGSQTSDAARTFAALGSPGSFLPELEEPVPGASNFPGRPHIYPFPPGALPLLRRLNDLCKLVVDELRQKCVDEARSEERPKAYSALTQDSSEWTQEEGKPCGGEKLLLMFDRWRKLAKAFYSDKKGEFDISKVPDIYDAAKYDSIHNGHLQLEHLQDAYTVAKILAAAVIPNEYGIQPHGKLRIGSMICAQLLGKLLADLASMREESIATAGLRHVDDASRADFVADLTAAMAAKKNAASGSSKGENGAEEENGENNNEDETPAGGEGCDDDDDDSVLHRLCPTYAQDINSPLRHVRTRIYFTSESHCHSLVNVLRYCQLGLDPGAQGLLSEAGQRLLHANLELDYMTHIVFRMFERKSLALDDPGRFRVEILFSPGAAHDPYAIVPLRRNHVIPVVQRAALHDGDASGVPLTLLEAACKPYAKPFKAACDPYALRGGAVTSQVSEVDYWM